MTKRMREIQNSITTKSAEATKFLNSESKDLQKAEALLDEIDTLQKEFDLCERAEKAEKAGVPLNGGGARIPARDAGNGFTAMLKIAKKQVNALTDTEKALITGTDSESGETYLIPDDVKTEINEKRKSYISARDLVEVVSTESLSGSVNYEGGNPTGLTAFDDGDAIAEETNPTFVKKQFAIALYGKLIPISNVLIGAERSGLMSYLDRWFVKNSIITENNKIFATLKAGYNSGTPKSIAGWKALKKSITVDLDPSCLYDGLIATNQSGFAALDEEEDDEGRPVLQPNPANATQKLFQSLPIIVFPDAQLPNIDTTHFPLIYGETKAGATFVEHQALQFALADQYLFNKNQNCLRVIEGFDVMSTDTGAYIYGSFSATPAPTSADKT